MDQPWPLSAPVVTKSGPSPEVTLVTMVSPMVLHGCSWASISYLSWDLLKSSTMDSRVLPSASEKPCHIVILTLPSAVVSASLLLPPQADRPTVAIMAKEAAAARALVLFLIFMDFSFSSWSPKTFPPTVAVTFINNLVCDVVHASSAALPFATL